MERYISKFEVLYTKVFNIVSFIVPHILCPIDGILIKWVSSNYHFATIPIYYY